MAHDDTDDAAEPLKRKAYERALKELHAELVKLQLWTKATGAKVCVIFEGRDGAGKGGVIKAIMERVSPRIFRVVALPPPTEREKSQMFIQRYVPHLPAAGEIIIFDRSWYNRAGVERVMGFCSDEQARKFLSTTPFVEKAIVESGVLLLKYGLEVSEEEQTRRMESRIDDPRDHTVRSLLKASEVLLHTRHLRALLIFEAVEMPLKEQVGRSRSIDRPIGPLTRIRVEPAVLVYETLLEHLRHEVVPLASRRTGVQFTQSLLIPIYVVLGRRVWVVPRVFAPIHLHHVGSRVFPALDLGHHVAPRDIFA